MQYMDKSPLFEDKLDNYFIVQEHDSLQFPLHIHPYIELVHVLEGQVEMQIGTEMYMLYKNDYAVIFPNVQHSYHTISDNHHTNLGITNCVLNLLPLHKNILTNNRPAVPVLHQNQLHSDFTWAENRLYSVNPKEDNKIFVGTLFSILLCHAYPLLDLQPFRNNETQDLTEQIVFYISKHALEDITLDIVSKNFGISKFKLSRIFSNTLKISFPDYLKKQRINNAAFLLTNTDKDITSIAYECGFNNQQSFNRAFLQVEGVTPSAFRKHLDGDKYPENLIPLLPEGILQTPSEVTTQPICISG